MKRGSLRYLLPLAGFVVMVGFLLVGLGLNPRLIPSPLIDKPVPAFTLPRLEDPGRQVSQAALEGEVSLVNVWASWCVSCRQEHPVLMQLAQEHGIPIHGINYKDRRSDALEYLRHGGNPFRWNGHDLDGRVGIDWGVYGTPETFVVDRQGRIRHKHTGPISPRQASEELLPVIERLRGETT